MSFSHREETRGDRLLDVLTDEAAGLRIIVSRLGAELISLARRNEQGSWIGFLYRDDDISAPLSGWANHATVMGYFLHRLKHGCSRYRGQPIEGGTHSFLRTKVWRLAADAAKGRLTYRIAPRDFTATEYPLRVSLDLTYELRAGAVHVTFRFENEEPETTAHIGFGLHPGFAAQSLSRSASRYLRGSTGDTFRRQITSRVKRRRSNLRVARCLSRASGSPVPTSLNSSMCRIALSSTTMRRPGAQFLSISAASRT